MVFCYTCPCDYHSTNSRRAFKAPVFQELLYTSSSHPKNYEKLHLMHFEPDLIRINSKALEEIHRMKKESLSSWHCPLKIMNGRNFYMGNIRSWNAHIAHFLSEKIYCEEYSLICFTETTVIGASPRERITQHLDGSSVIYKQTFHGLSLNSNTDNMEITQEFDKVISQLKLLPLLLQLQN